METIQLNGISHKIRFNFNALKEFKKVNGGTGLSFDDLDVSTILDLTYAGLKEARRIECKGDGIPQDFSLTVEDIGEHMTVDTMNDVIAILTDSLSGGKKEEKK